VGNRRIGSIAPRQPSHNVQAHFDGDVFTGVLSAAEQYLRLVLVRADVVADLYQQ
jgi:hypothetical protein